MVARQSDWVEVWVETNAACSRSGSCDIRLARIATMLLHTEHQQYNHSHFEGIIWSTHDSTVTGDCSKVLIRHSPFSH
jgi:hypothetical protein